MESRVPQELRAEQRAVEADLRSALRGVRRAGGVTWSESRVVDLYGYEDERVAARAKDVERGWEELVDDPGWDEEPGIGGFNFLDAIGYTYYMAPAMMRCARRGGGEFTCYALIIDNDFKRELVRLITPAQAAAVARFIRYMIAVHNAVGDDISVESWAHAYKSYWREWDRGAPLA